ncbi:MULTISPECIES: hypothetical protein [Pseudomonas]|uniref:hypothetical protein n=1 Tax=Pseudomonas TaxID=286 RepID=UPI0028EC605E|nr:MULTISPECIES: hypothetical protein [Pseudomonas]
MSDADETRIPAPRRGNELHDLLRGVRRGDVFHPALKRWLVHLRLAEFRGLQLVLTNQGQRLAQS